jgi:FixJ family two-component response regulator
MKLPPGIGPLLAVVDDNDAVREAMDALLRAVGYRVVSFNSGEAFLDTACARDFDCILLDMRLPGMSGLELQRRLMDEGIRTPIIFVSSSDAAGWRRAQAIEWGARAFLGKPLRDQDLLREIRHAVAA